MYATEQDCDNAGVFLILLAYDCAHLTDDPDLGGPCSPLMQLCLFYDSCRLCVISLAGD